ncbi:hypothetical protein DL98DRAFT_542407 [Cadophora sp. DSE1049]|nr:hypothetical protein DL98DRAFT_542407 [Cadophora sp. DSE1049]
MDISGVIQSYDSQVGLPAALTQTIIAPQYSPAQTYSATTHNMVVTHQQQHQHNPFNFSGYSGPNTNIIVPAFSNCNFIQQRPLPRLMQVEDDRIRQVSYPRQSRQGYIEEHHSQSPPIKAEPIKAEPMWPTPTNAPVFHSNDVKTSPTSSQAQEINFETEVDTLMKAIQAKEQTTQPQAASSAEQIGPVVGAFHPASSAQATSQIGVYASREETKYKLTHSTLQEESSSPKNPKKRYQCTIANCNKSFYQKTHLDIHERAHTGVKPYPCKEPGCGRMFSQLGNLKTHERRHTGERPYQCEICGKRFAQRGNVRAHKIVHDKSKPYRCRLDDCGKQFTQLGNLKQVKQNQEDKARQDKTPKLTILQQSHQNKFHIDTIRNLTAKFASIKDRDIVHAGDKELWEYFANLYKNSNKGIKGRGKDRKVGSASSSSMALNSGMRSLGVNGRGFGMAGPGRGNMVVGVGGQYEMFDVDNGSQSGHSYSGSGGASSGGTYYEDAPSDGCEDQGRSNDELAFGDRLY